MYRSVVIDPMSPRIGTVGTDGILRSDSHVSNNLSRETRTMPEPRIAAIVTEYFEHSHADVTVSYFLEGFPSDQGIVKPQSKIVSMWLDQVGPRDKGVAKVKEHGVPIYPSIRAALLCGTETLAVDGVLVIGEHGDYPHDEFGRHMYPRRHLFEQVCGVFAETGKTCPVFVDKHLSYNPEDAVWMANRQRELGFPMMAGSSLPLSWRDPEVELPLESDITEAVALGFGPLEAYGYHTLESLQCMVERRRGGEKGVRAVTYLRGDDVWRAADRGLWSEDLVNAALKTVFTKKDEPPRTGCANPEAIVIEYRDGFRATALQLDGYIVDWAVALRIGGKIVATEFAVEYSAPFSHFGYLSRNIEKMFLTGKPGYPWERTFITTGIINATMLSAAKKSERIETPWLDVKYMSYKEMPIRSTSGKRPGKTGEGYKPIGYSDNE